MIITSQAEYIPYGGLFASGGSVPDVARAIDGALDLTAPRHVVFETLTNQDGETQTAYLEMLSRLLKAGIVGTETLDEGGRPYTRFASTAIADSQHRGAAPYRRLDVRG